MFLGPEGKTSSPLKSAKTRRPPGGLLVAVTSYEGHVSVARLVGGVCDVQRMLRHLCLGILWHYAHANVHEPPVLRVLEEPIVIDLVAVTIRKSTPRARLVRAELLQGPQEPPSGRGSGEVGVVQLVGIAEHGGGQHVRP